MRKPTRAGEVVAIPVQGRAEQTRGYRPRHRSEDATIDPATGLVERAYATPTWMAESNVVQLPRQSPRPRSVHDRVVERGTELSYERPADLPHRARWVTPRNGTSSLAILLVAAVAAAGATASGVLERQSTPALAIALVLVLVASGINAVLVALRPTVVELDECWITVRHRGRSDRFDLSNPFLRLRVGGTPGTSSWTVDFGCPDGRVVTVTHGMADSRTLAPVVEYAQRYAERDRRARVERFSR